MRALALLLVLLASPAWAADTLFGPGGGGGSSITTLAQFPDLCPADQGVFRNVTDTANECRVAGSGSGDSLLFGGVAMSDAGGLNFVDSPTIGMNFATGVSPDTSTPAVVGNSLTASHIDETGPFTFTDLRGKITRNGAAVDDDDCTGDQGKYWYDTTDSRFEFCSLNTGVPDVIGAHDFATLNAGTFTGGGLRIGSGATLDATGGGIIVATSASAAGTLQVDGANCTGNQFALGTNEAGVAQCAQPAFTNLSGSIAGAQIPSNTIVTDKILDGNVTAAKLDLTGETYDYSGSTLRFYNVIAAKTSTSSVSADEAKGALLTNAGASGDIILSLPAAAAGMSLCVALTVGIAGSHDVTINPDNTDVIIIAGTGALSAGDAISTNSGGDVGDMVCLNAVDATNWLAVLVGGVWQDVN